MENLTKPEFIKAITPLILALLGCFIGGMVILKGLQGENATAGFGLAGTAITGAAGLAQSSGKNDE